MADVASFRRDEALRLPDDLDYRAHLPGLSNEVQAQLGRSTAAVRSGRRRALKASRRRR